MSESDAVVPSFMTVVLSESFSVFSAAAPCSEPMLPVVEPEPIEPEPVAVLDASALSAMVMVLFERSSSFTRPCTSLVMLLVPVVEAVSLPDPVVEPVEPIDPLPVEELEPVEPVEGSEDVLPWLD
jgi:hypothetical protein